VDEAWLDLVRVARDCGNISSLLPPGIDNLIDMPFHLHRAVVAALGFLGFEELPQDERPPKRIWLDGNKLNAWFNDVRARRKAEMEGHATPEMSESPLKKELLVGFDGA